MPSLGHGATGRRRPRFNEAAGADPADAVLIARNRTFADIRASMRPRGQTPRMHQGAMYNAMQNMTVLQ